MTIYDTSIDALDGGTLDLSAYEGRTVLIVNVASKCGLTPQYTGLEELQKRYEDRGFTVLGVPCNPVRRAGAGHGGGDPDVLLHHLRRDVPPDREGRRQRPGPSPALPGADGRPDAAGEAGDITWNFEKFLVSPEGEVVSRFRPQVEPQATEVVEAIERTLPA